MSISQPFCCGHEASRGRSRRSITASSSSIVRSEGFEARGTRSFGKAPPMHQGHVGPVPGSWSRTQIRVCCPSRGRGRRAGARTPYPPVMVGIVLLATCLLPADVAFYCLVFRLANRCTGSPRPQQPPGAGIFDQLAAHGTPPRLSASAYLAVALSIVSVAVPEPSHSALTRSMAEAKGVVGTILVFTTVTWAPFLWLVTCVVIIVSTRTKPTHT